MMITPVEPCVIPVLLCAAVLLMLQSALFMSSAANLQDAASFSIIKFLPSAQVISEALGQRDKYIAIWRTKTADLRKVLRG